jgi:glycerol-3-phosphate dehydrogenase
MQTQVLILGGGATGTGLARDLAMRGVDCILVEKRDLSAGASGANHGLLHSGARYVSTDLESAVECRKEGELLKKLAPHLIDDTGGLFAAVKGDDESYIADFPGYCEKAGISCKEIDPKEALELEPSLSPETVAVFEVPDASLDPFGLVLENVSDAQEKGAKFMRRTGLVSFRMNGERIRSAVLEHTRTGERMEIEAEVYVNATGAWADEVAGVAGLGIPMLYSKGTLAVTHHRVAHRVINRLRPPSDADILVPGGSVSILGTTSVTIDDLNEILPTVSEVDHIVAEGSKMIPELERERYIRAYAGVRPLLKPGGSEDGREASRGFALIDHASEGVENFISITGGKLTTFRLMAEKTADKVCDRLGVDEPCRTAEEPYPCSVTWQWTEPAHVGMETIRRADPGDVLLCECEMIPRKAIDGILSKFDERGGKPGLKALSRRSRLGKGSCQGNFCALRTTAHLYDSGRLENAQGVDNLREFLSERWRGQRPILWDMPLIQSELQEALHCALLGLELEHGGGDE